MPYSIKMDLSPIEIASLFAMIVSEIESIEVEGRQNTPFARAMAEAVSEVGAYVNSGYAEDCTVKLNLDEYAVGALHVRLNCEADEETRFGAPTTPYGQAVVSVRDKWNGYRAAVAAVKH